MDAAARLGPDVVVVDAGLPDSAAPALIADLRARGAAVVALAASRDLDHAFRAVELGAESVVPRDAEPAHIVAAAARAAEKARLLRHVTHLRAGDGAADLDALGPSPMMRQLAERITRVAAGRAPVLLTGESGTGKGRVAALIHALGPRAPAPFVALRSAAHVPALARAGLFGYERGAFAEARERRLGLVELADRGSLYVDEICEVPPDAQAVLLQLIDGGRFRRVGGTRDLAVDVRIIAATDRDLVAALQGARLREDLLYRLSVTTIALPPLRERAQEDRLALIGQIAAELRARVPGSPATWSAEALDRLTGAPWPGNVRELRNALERTLLSARGAPEVALDHLPGELRARGAAGERRAFQPMPLADLERHHIERALRHFRGNRTRTARALGISRATLINKIRSYGLN
jgi:DNA-binding NtrC family response regulator